MVIQPVIGGASDSIDKLDQTVKDYCSYGVGGKDVGFNVFHPFQSINPYVNAGRTIVKYGILQNSKAYFFNIYLVFSKDLQSVNVNGTLPFICPDDWYSFINSFVNESGNTLPIRFFNSETKKDNILVDVQNKTTKLFLISETYKANSIIRFSFLYRTGYYNSVI